MASEIPSGTEGIIVPYDQAFIDQLKSHEGFPRRVLDVLESALKSGNPPSTETIEAALDEAGIPKLRTPLLSREDYLRICAKMDMTPEEMDKYINFPPQQEVLGADRITFINSPALGEAIVEALPEGVDVPLHEAIDKVVAVLGKPKE